jgi:hypothetical protein
MGFDEEFNLEKGLEIGTNAPIINTNDILGNEINTTNN